MLPLSALSEQEAQRLVGVLFDLDDTFLDQRRLTLEAYAALHRLKADGWLAIAVTGRPAAWGQWVTELWPIDGAVAENGAVSLIKEGGRVRSFDRLSTSERRERQRALIGIVNRLREEFPELKPTGDRRLRRADYTFDVGERRNVSRAVVESVRRRARELGAYTSVSSIHLHVTLDGDDKASGCMRLVDLSFGHDPGRARYEFAFIGDSGNDAPCFAAFETTIAVSNWSGVFTRPPRYVTERERGLGFAEAVNWLCERRRGAMNRAIVPKGAGLNS